MHMFAIVVRSVVMKMPAWEDETGELLQEHGPQALEMKIAAPQIKNLKLCTTESINSVAMATWTAISKIYVPRRMAE